MRLWDTTTGRSLQILDIPKANLVSLNFSDDGQSLIGLTNQRILHLWDPITGKLQKTFRPKYNKIRVKGMEWDRALAAFVDPTRDATFAIGNHDGTISIQDGNNRKLIKTLVARTNEAAFYKIGDVTKPPKVIVQLNPNDDTASFPTQYRDDGTPFPIQYKLGQSHVYPKTHKEQPIKWLARLEFSPDGKTLVSSCEYRNPRFKGYSARSGPIEIWDIDTNEQLAALPPYIDVKFSNDGKRLALIGSAGCVIWDINTRNKIATFSEVKTVRFSGDGKLLYLISKDNYTVWDLVAGQEISRVSLDLDESKPFPDRFVASR